MEKYKYNEEMKLFLALIMWMGLAPLPTIANNWGKKGVYTSHIPKYMKLRRFELFLRTFHLNNNEECPRGDRLFKVQSLIDFLVSK